MRPILALACLLTRLMGGGCLAEDLSSLRTDGLPGFWSGVETGTGPVTVLNIGDSLQTPWRSLGQHLNRRLQDRLGFAGYTLAAQLQPFALVSYSGGAAAAVPDREWWTDSSRLPAGGAVQWTYADNPTGSVLADRLGVYFITSLAPCQFSVLVSSNGGGWSKIASVPAQSGSAEGRYAGFSLPLGLYRMRLEGDLGTVRIVGPEMFKSGSHGLKPVYMATDGCNLSQIIATPPSILFPLLTQINPSLIVWHMKEYADLGAVGLSNRLRDLDAVWKQALPRAEVIYVGTPYEQRDTTNAFTLIQNRIVRAAALRAGRSYFDGMTPFVSYEFMKARGYLDDNVHPSNALYAEMARLLWGEFGFYALGASRTLNARVLGGEQVIRFDATPGLVYDLESSSDLQTWTRRLRSQIPPAGQPVSIHYTNGLPGNVSFRLTVLPDPSAQ